MCAQPVPRARRDIRDEAVADLAGTLGQREALLLARAVRVEEAQFDRGGVGGKDRDVDTAVNRGDAKRLGAAGTDVAHRLHAPRAELAEQRGVLLRRARPADVGRHRPPLQSAPLPGIAP